MTTPQSTFNSKSAPPAGRPTILVTGTVVANGGDRAIFETEARLLESAVPGVALPISDNRPDIARTVVGPSTQVYPPPFTRLRFVKGRSKISGAINRATYWRVITAGRLLRRGYLRAARLILSAGEERMITEIAGVSAVVATGGTTLIENYWMRPKLFELDLAAALGKPIALMTQSLGPFREPENVRGIRRVCAVAKLILLRDQVSLGHLLEIGADTSRCVVLPDVVFAGADVTSAARLRDRRTPRHGARVAISVRDLANFKSLASADVPARFIDGIRELVIEIVRAHGAQVVFVSTCQGLPDYWTDDSAIATTIVAGLPGDVRNSVVVDTAFHTTEDFIQILAGCDLLIGTRLHACILSLVAGTVTLPIAYEFKTHTVYSQLGAPEIVVDAADVSGQALIDGFEHLLQTQGTLRGVLADGLAEVSAEAASAGGLVVRALGLQPFSIRTVAGTEQAVVQHVR